MNSDIIKYNLAIPLKACEVPLYEVEIDYLFEETRAGR